MKQEYKKVDSRWGGVGGSGGSSCYSVLEQVWKFHYRMLKAGRMTGVRQNLHWWSVRGAVWSWSSFPLWSASTDRWWFWKRRGGRMADTSASILQAKWLPVRGKGTGLFACKRFGPAAFLELVISLTQRFPPFCMCNITWEVGKRVTPWPLPKPMNWASPGKGPNVGILKMHRSLMCGQNLWIWTAPFKLQCDADFLGIG